MKQEGKISSAVVESLDDYFKHLDGEQPNAVYDMVLGCVEEPMLLFILNKTGGNQSQAAKILGINRNTLRKKMAQYNID